MATAQRRRRRRLLTTTQAGYGSEHQKLRAWWKPKVDAGEAWCHAIVCLYSTRWIKPGMDWDLGHTRDRTGYRGPEHAKCNRREGGIRGNKSPRRRFATSRRW